MGILIEIIGGLIQELIWAMVGRYVKALQERPFIRNGLSIILTLLTLASCIIAFSSTATIPIEYIRVATLSSCIFGPMLILSLAAFLPRNLRGASRDSRSGTQIPSVFDRARGFQSAISMDGATCLKANDGSVIIRRHALRNAFVVVSLGVLGFGLLVLAVWVVTDILRGKSIPEVPAVFVGAGILIGAALFTIGRSAVRSLLQPAIYINANSRTFESGRGSTAQQILFSRISHISTTPPTTSLLEGVTRIGIQVTLDNGEVIKLGSVSGRDANKAHTRAAALAQLVADVTGATIREPVEPIIR